MFCPKCGTQNADATKFCRGCGSDISNTSAALAIKAQGELSLAEKQVELFGGGMRGVMVGAGFLLTAAAAFAISVKLSVLVIFLLAFASFFLGTGISRLIQAKALKRLRPASEDSEQAALGLAPGQTDYLEPPRSIYQTDDLTARSPSVTENTTRHLELGDDGETVSLSKK